MTKSKIADSDVVAYLQERKQSLQEELNKIDTVLTSFGVGEEPADKKSKKKIKKKKLEKTVNAIRKKAAKAIKGIKSQAGALADSISSSDAGPAEASKPEATAAVTAVPEATVKKSRVRKAAGNQKAEDIPTGTKETPAKKSKTTKAKASSKETAVPVPTASAKPAVSTSFEPSATMDEKIRYALNQKGSITREELINYLNELEPSYDLTKLRRAIAFRLNHLLKTGQIKGQESAAGFRYSN